MTTNLDLAGLVKQYRVCWEVWPEICPGSNHTQVGYEVELFGTNPQVQALEVSPRDCERIRAVLETVAMNVVERHPDVLTESFGDGQSFHYSAARGNRPDVTFSLKILHRHGYGSPVDQSEREFLENVKKRLRLLGAQEHCWRETENHARKQ